MEKRMQNDVAALGFRVLVLGLPETLGLDIYMGPTH